MAAGWLFLSAMPLRSAPAHDYGFLASGGEDVRGRGGVHAAGPVFEWTADADPGIVRAVRPFFAYESREAGRKTVLDVLWPVGSFRSWGRQSDWRFLTVFGRDYDNEDPASRYHCWILPFVIMGKDAAGEDYGAVFPLGGKIGGFLGQDEVSFAAFPLYLHTRLNEEETDSLLWPMISRTRGKHGHSFRVAPFYGKSIRYGEWEKEFIAWPFWTSVRYERPGAKGYAYILLPLYGRVNMENQQSWMILPPFIRWASSARGREGYAPWPFVQFSSGETDQLYLWPLWGRKEDAFESSGFWLWPLIAHSKTKGQRTERARFRAFPLVFSGKECVKGSNAVSVVTDRYFALWPLVSYHAGRQGSSVKALCLWPVKDTRPIDRNLAPLWTVFDREAAENAVRTELLWGLARWGREANGVASCSVFPLASWAGGGSGEENRTSWSLLKGLIGYDRRGESRQYRLLYFMEWGGKP